MFRCTVQCNYGTPGCPQLLPHPAAWTIPTLARCAMFWGLSEGFLISTFKTAAGYSNQNKQGHPAPMEHEGSWSLLHLQPQTSPDMWRLPVGLMAKQWHQSSTTSPNSFSEGAAPFVSKQLLEVSFLLINLIVMVMCHSARLKSHTGKGISMNLQRN